MIDFLSLAVTLLSPHLCEVGDIDPHPQLLWWRRPWP